MDFAYQSEKFAAARRCLMLPHPRSEAESIASAFHECSLGLHKFDLDKLDDNARSWVNRLNGFMNTSDYSDPHKEGLWLVKARGFSSEDQFEISQIVDELAHWFRRKAWDT